MTPIKVGDPVTVDGLPGRGVVVKLEGRILTIKFRSGEYLSRDIRYVHSMNENTVNKMWNENQHQLTAGGVGSGCRGSNCGRKLSDKTKDVFFNKRPAEYAVGGNLGRTRLEDISVRKLIPTQHDLDINTVKKYMKSSTNPPSSVWTFNGKHYLIDGHHRVAADIVKGNKTTRVTNFYFKGKPQWYAMSAAREWTELEEGKPIDRRPVEDGVIEQQGTLFCVKKGIENFGCYPTYEAAEERLHMSQSTVQAGRGIQHFGITKADKAILTQFDDTWKWGGRISKRAHLLARAGYLQRDGFKFKMTAKGHDALTGKDDSHIHGGGVGSGCHGENCGRKASQMLEHHGWQKTKEWEDGAIYRHPDHPTAKIAVNHSEGTWRSRDSEGQEQDLHKHLANIHGGGPGSGRKPSTPKGLNKWKSRDEELKDASKDPKQLKLPLKGSAPGTGWDYGQRHGVGFIPKRTLSGFPKGRGKGAGAPSNSTGARAPNPSLGRSTSAPGMRRPNTAMPAPKISMRPKMPSLRADYSGEPMAGNMAHSHIDPQVWFHPPSLKNADRVPTDDPGETDDKYGDVTKRNSKDTQEFRMKMLKKSSPGAMETVPVRTTLIAPNSGVYMPGQISGSGMLKQRPAKIMGAKRTHVSYNRRGCI